MSAGSLAAAEKKLVRVPALVRVPLALVPALAAGDILDELPGDASGPRSPLHRPGKRLAPHPKPALLMSMELGIELVVLGLQQAALRVRQLSASGISAPLFLLPLLR